MINKNITNVTNAAPQVTDVTNVTDTAQADVAEVTSKFNISAKAVEVLAEELGKRAMIQADDLTILGDASGLEALLVESYDSDTVKLTFEKLDTFKGMVCYYQGTVVEADELVKLVDVSTLPAECGLGL